jgi:hypothetical protein
MHGAYGGSDASGNSGGDMAMASTSPPWNSMVITALPMW